MARKVNLIILNFIRLEATNQKGKTMRFGICPKCNSSEIYRGISTDGEGLTAGSYISLVEIRAGKQQATLWVDTYICRACGYLELFVANPADLAFLPQADGWVKVAVDPDSEGGAGQESHDTFCTSCHTMPESTFYDRSTAAQPVDLASFHTTKNTACIDCHSGQGIFGRIQAELMGARNAFKWYTGTAVQPAVLTFPIGDGNCLKCHQQVTQQNFSPQEQITVPGGSNGGRGEQGRANHWHAYLGLVKE